MKALRKVIILVEQPDNCSNKEFEEWIKFELGITQSVSIYNPMNDKDLIAKKVEIL